MNTIQTTYINALLADASYVTLSENGIVITNQAVLKTNLTAVLTQPQATYLLENFDILTQTLSPTGGFDAVVWRGKSTAGSDLADKVFVSMRGTQELQDFADDGSLAARGIPYNQIRDMANWWMRATAQAGDMVKQIKVDSVVTPWLTKYTFAADTSVAATGELHGQVGQIAAVNGHSLGGYLATAFTRLFGKNAQEVNTFNSAGFSDAAGDNVKSEFDKVETLLGTAALGMGSFEAAGNKQTNYRAGNGVSVTTNNWGEMPYWALGFNQYGDKVALYQEEGVGFSNHSMYKQTDLLALGVMLSKLDTSLALDKLNTLIQAGSNDMKASYESVLDAVRQLVSPTRITATQVGDVTINDNLWECAA